MPDWKLIQEILVPASHGKAWRAKKGQHVEIIDVQGQQVGDLMAWCADDESEYFSPAHTVTRNWSIALKVGDCLATNKRRDIFRIVRDTVGYHDIVVPCCDEQTYITRYGIHNHRSCKSNILEGLAELHETPHVSGELAWNVFMKTRIEGDGKIIYEEPTHSPGSNIVLECLMDVVMSLSACPQDQTPTNGWECTELLVKVLDPHG
jgi:uncharacterized protein